MKIKSALNCGVFPYLLMLLMGNTFAQNVVIWGNNENGESSVPNDLTNVVAATVGSYRWAALLDDGSIRKQVYGSFDLSNTTNVVAISLGTHQGIALHNDGTVSSLFTGGDSNIPIGLSNVVSISSGGYDHHLALKADGTVVEWGLQFYTNMPINLSNVVAVSAGATYSLALKSNGKVVGWGNNSYGQIPPASLSGIVAISAGGIHSLVLKSNGTVLSYGDNSMGQRTVPPGLGLTNITTICAGAWHNLAIRLDGSVIAWGNSNSSVTSVPIDLPYALAISASTNNSLAVVSLGTPVSPPTIRSVYPQAQTVSIGSSAYFVVHSIGVSTLNYQWYFGSNAIFGATNKVLYLSNLNTSQSGEYAVTVSNSIGLVKSSTVSLSVLSSLGINMVPAISMFGQIGLNYNLEYLSSVGPTNNWMVLDTVTISMNPQFYCDTSAIGQPFRIYRLVQLSH